MAGAALVLVLANRRMSSFRDLIARCAVEHGIALERGYRAHGLSNYHLMSDTPDNLNYETIAHAARIGYAVAHHLSQRG